MNIFALILAAIFVPEANDATIREYPLERGEMAFIDRGESTANLKIGALDVTDPTTLHGYIINEVDDAVVSKIFPSEITYFAGSDRYECVGQDTNVPWRIAFNIPQDMEIYNVTYQSVNDDGTGSAMLPSSYAGTIDLTFAANNAVITLTRKEKYRSGSRFWVEDVKIFVKKIGNVAANDVRVGGLQIPLVDDEGEIELRQMRTWAKNLYNGNRGNDWSKYDATSTVHLVGHTMSFDRNNRFTMSVPSVSNFVMQASGKKVMEVVATGSGGSYEGAFWITRISCSAADEVVLLNFHQDIDGFDIEGLILQYTDDIVDPIWLEVPNYDKSNTSSGNGMITAYDQDQGTGCRRFYRLSYRGSVSDAYELRVEAPTTFLNDVFIIGDDGVKYRLSINAGVISALPAN